MRKRKVLLICLSILLCCAVFIILIPSLFKKQVSELLQKELNENIVAEVSFSNADINLWRHFPNLTITLDKFIIAGKKQFVGDTLIRVHELHLVLGTSELIIDNQIQVRELSFYDPYFHVIRASNGKSNYEIFNMADSADSESGADMNMDVQSLKIENGNFIFEDQNLELLLKGAGIKLNGEADIAGNIYDLNIETEINSFTSMMSNKTYVRNKHIYFDLEAAYDFKNQILHFKDNQISINHLELGVEGMYAYKEDGHYFDVKFHSADTDFKDFLSLSDDLFRDNFNGVNIKGQLKLEGYVKGHYNAERNIIPGFKIDFKVSDGLVKYDALSSSINEINFDLVAENSDSIWESTVLDLKHFNMNFGKNPFKGYLKIEGFKNGTVKSDIIAQIDLEDLEKIRPIEGISLNGKLDLDLKAEGTFTGFLAELEQSTDMIRKKIPPFKISLNIKNGNFKYDHLPQAVNNINFHMKAENTSGIFDHTSIRIEKLEATLGDNPLKGFIHINGFKNPVINADIHADLNLAEIKDFYPLEGMLLKGLFDLDMKIDGQLNDSLKTFPIVDSKIKITDAYVKSDAYPFPMETTHLVVETTNQTGKLKDTKINIDTLTYSIEGESFDVKGTISDLEKYTYNLGVKGVLYLDKLSRIFQLSDDLKMSGEVDVDLQTSGNYQDLREEKYHRLPTSGKMLMKDIFVQNDYFPHGLFVKQGHLFFSNEKIFLDTLHGAVGSSNFNLTGHLYNYLAFVLHSDENIRGNLLFESDTFNINELMSDKKIVKGDSSHHEFSVFKIPENIDFTFDSKIDHLLYKDLEMDNLKGELQFRDGVLTLNETRFDALNADFVISGDYDTRDIDHPLFDLDLSIEELDINKAHKAFVTVQAIAPAAEDTYGVFSMDYVIKGGLLPDMYPIFESLEGGGTVRIREAKVNGMKVFHHISGITKKEELMNPMLKDIVMETIVKDGTIYVKPFNMKLAGFDTDIEGQHDIHGTMNYVLKMAIPPFDIVKIPLHVNGTYDKPKIHLGKGHEETLKKIIASSH
jgi:AsmA protein